MLAAPWTSAADCNPNGIHAEIDLEPRTPAYDSSGVYPLPSTPTAMVSADLDEDGDTDIAAPSDPGAVLSVLLNEGGGAFATTAARRRATGTASGKAL